MTRPYRGDTSGAGPSTATRELVRDDYDDDVVFYQDSSPWRWAAAVGGVVLVLAVILAILIVRGGDGSSTMTGVVPSRSAPVLTPPAATSRPSPPPTASLAPETVSTVTPSPTITPSPTEAVPTPATPQADPRTVTYTVSGSRQPGDIVTVTYLDEAGMPRTDFNVTLPWTKTVISGGNVLLNSVTAVSLASHLNCTITDANGQAVASQDYNTIATTCNR
jgi:hypothetical protein